MYLTSNSIRDSSRLFRITSSSISLYLLHVFSIGWQVEVTFLKSYGCAKLKRAEDKEIMFLVLYGSHHWCGPMDVTRMGCVYIVSYTYTLCYTI